MTELRPYQVRALDETRRAYCRGKRSICVTMPTGSGKTRLGVEFAKGHLAKGGRVLWLAHRAELISQAAERLRAEGVPEVGVIAADIDNPAPNAPVQVASTQTLLARGYYPPASLVVPDELHHYRADTWRTLIEHYSSSIRLGLTATPERGDGKPLKDICDHIVVGATPRELTELGYLVPCEVIAPAKYNPRRLAGDPVEKYLEHAIGTQAFVFASDIAHAEDLARAYNAAGVPAAVVTGETHRDERAAVLAAFRRGDILALCNVGIFTEGTDVPEVETAVLCRGLGSAGAYLQIVGRILRPAPNKTRALFIDLPGVSRKYGLPTDDREFSLSGKKGIIWTNKPGRRMRPEQVNAALYRVSGRDPAKASFLREKQAEAAARGFKPGWAIHKFVERFGHPPWRAA